uniref:Ganglioside-induced differentiation-associated protein 2 n=1 Tax=Aceria tosichella TaxID=561515 RepID=A0A6G1S5K5_9ACAR
MDTVNVRDLQVADSTLTETDLEFYKTGETGRRWSTSPIAIDDDINRRVFLYDGDIELISAEAIVNPTNEALTELGYVLKIAGPELTEFIKKKTRNCATGEVHITPCFNPNYKHIIHAVPPKFQPKYQTAAETALFHTYFRILETMIERKIRTVVMPTLSTVKCNFPMEANCQLQLRVIRRMLEKKRHEFDKIVVHVRDIESCATCFYSYFPRTPLDQEIACYYLPGSLGGPNGEPVIPEREIRIKSKPAVLGGLHDNSIDLTTGLDLSTVVGKTAFSKMREDLESKASSTGGRCTRNFSPGSKSSQSNQIVVRKKSVFTGCNLF